MLAEIFTERTLSMIQYVRLQAWPPMLTAGRKFKKSKNLP
jgi:hypothetical protein